MMKGRTSGNAPSGSGMTYGQSNTDTKVNEAATAPEINNT